jgi:deazaflavin-dependent oxidoreductase (nitroreductase family)
MNGLPTVLMTYRGAKTGKVRKTPVMRVEHEGRYVVVASNGGQPTNPQWYASLVAEPIIELQDGTVIREHRAREVFGDEKALWWRRAVEAYPDYADCQRKTRMPDPGYRARTDQRGSAVDILIHRFAWWLWPRSRPAGLVNSSAPGS